MSVNAWLVHGMIHAAGSIFHPVSRAVSTSSNFAAPTEVPDVATLLDLYIKGWIGKDQLRVFARGQGVALDLDKQTNYGVNDPGIQNIENTWIAVLESKQEFPTPQESFVLTNRGLFSVEILDNILSRHGFSNDLIRESMQNLRFEIPGSSDLVRFSVRHVFEPDLVERLGYNDEFRPVLDFWHKLQGLNYPLFSGPFAGQIASFEQSRGLQPGSFIESYARAGLEDPTWAQAYWWAHWVVPSASQAYEMYFRLRPDRNRAFDPPFARDLNFSLDDLNLNLRANDYPPRVRAALAAIAHRIPGIRFLRQLRATDVFTQKDVTELLLRQGYSPGDAAVLAESVERADRDARRKTIEQQAKGQLAKYWELGAIDSGQYRDLLIQHGFTARQADDTVTLADLDLKFKRLQKIIDFVRKQVVSGAINTTQAADQLRQAGVVNERIAAYLEDWDLEVKVKHREISAQKAVKWACQGLINLEQLQTRLQNLGYHPQDVDGLIAEARICQAGLATRAATQAAKQQAASARQLQRVQREAARAIVEARRQLASHGSPSQLRKWFCAGHLDQASLYSRLRYLGWPDEDITRLISDCQSAKGGGKGGQRGGSKVGG